MTFAHQILQGVTWHARQIPTSHEFHYPYRFWAVNLTQLADNPLPNVNMGASDVPKWLPQWLKKWLKKSLQQSLTIPLLSQHHWALYQFHQADYFAINRLDTSLDNRLTASVGQPAPSASLLVKAQQTWQQLTGSQPTGEVVALVVLRNMGWYFSPVNFYIGFDENHQPSHFLAEVSNTPWNKRHYYGFLLTGEKTLYQHDKGFHVSPFNPINQQYHWRVEIDPKRYASANDNPEQNGFDVVIDIGLTDSRGKVFNAGVSLTGVQLDEASVITAIKRRPWMSATSLLRIYWQAFKLYVLKRVPYQAYNQRLPQ